MTDDRAPTGRDATARGSAGARPASARRRDRWSPPPTTEAGRRRRFRRRAWLGFAGLAVVAIAAATARFLDRPGPDCMAYFLGEFELPPYVDVADVRVASRPVLDGRALAYEVRIYEVRIVEAPASPDRAEPTVAVRVLRLPADDVAVTRFAAGLADELARRGPPRRLAWRDADVRDADAPTAERVRDALAVRGYPVGELPPTSGR